jgi:hypothetical protein
MQQISINHDQQLYVVPVGDGYSSWGFDFAMREVRALAERLGAMELYPVDEERGSLSVLEKHAGLIKMAKTRDLGTWYDPRTPERLRTILEYLRLKREPVRIFLGDRETGRDWMEEFDTIGLIGRSTGTLKVPLLVEEGTRSGFSLLDSSIVRIISVKNGKEAYRHPAYHLPEMRVAENEHPELPFTVLTNGKPHARFKTMAQVCHWIAFMAGEVVYEHP